MANFFWHTLRISFAETIYLAGGLIAVGFILGFMETLSNTCLMRAFGRRGVLLTAWIGTPVHEIGHLLQCILWGHRVQKVKLLQLNHPDGVLGYVEHSYHPDSLYQQVGNFFIGMGPIFSGIGSLLLAMMLLVPRSYASFRDQVQQHLAFGQPDVHLFQAVADIVAAVIRSLFTLHNAAEPSFWLFMLLAASVSSHIALSKADIHNAAGGLAAIFTLLFFCSAAAGFLHLHSGKVSPLLGEYNAYLLAFSSIAVLFSLVTLGLSLLCCTIKTVLLA